MNPLRRLLLKGAGASGAALAAIAAGALKPGQVLAATWNTGAFEAKKVGDAMSGLGIANAVDSADIVMKAPDIAENGAVVPIEVTSNVPNTQKISIFIDNNPNPLCASFDLSGGAMPSISVRVKMQQTSNVRAVAHAGGKFYVAAKEVKVTIGGCGG